MDTPYTSIIYQEHYTFIERKINTKSSSKLTQPPSHLPATDNTSRGDDKKPIKSKEGQQTKADNAKSCPLTKINRNKGENNILFHDHSSRRGVKETTEDDDASRWSTSRHKSAKVTQTL